MHFKQTSIESDLQPLVGKHQIGLHTDTKRYRRWIGLTKLFDILIWVTKGHC